MERVRSSGTWGHLPGRSVTLEPDEAAHMASDDRWRGPRVRAGRYVGDRQLEHRPRSRRLQLTRETVTIANYYDSPVVFASEHSKHLERPITLLNQYANVTTAGTATALLQANGWRILKQRFPRSAYVLVPAGAVDRSLQIRLAKEIWEEAAHCLRGVRGAPAVNY